MSEFGFQWHVTDRCNMRCVHCYQNRFDNSLDLPQDKVLSLADRILDTIPDTEVSINLTGGEPLLWPHLLPLLKRLHGKPNFVEANLITNATVVDSKLIAGLAEFNRLRSIKVSVESGDPQVNDAIRGDGNLLRTLRHLPLYQRHWPVVWMMTLGRHNVSTIATTIRLARAQGVSGIIFERFVPLGQSQMAQELVLNQKSWDYAVDAILEEAEIEAYPEDLAIYRAFWLWTEAGHEEPLQGALCNLGEQSMALLPDATVYPCRRLPIRIGNALQEAFPEIQKRLANYNQILPPSRTASNSRGGNIYPGCRALTQAMSGEKLEI